MWIDGHSHHLLSLTGRDNPAREALSAQDLVDGPRNGGLSAIGLTIGGDRAYATPGTLGPWAGTLDSLDRVLSCIRGHGRLIRPLLSATDLAGSADSALFLMLHVEGLLPLFDAPFDDPRIGLRLLHALGVRSVQPIGSPQTPFLDESGRVSQAGSGILEEIEQLGMVLDLSHLTGDNDALMDIAQRSAGPVVISHAVLRRVHGSATGITEDAACAIAETGGIIGLPLGSNHLAGSARQANIDDFLEHVDALSSVVGIDHVGIGTDWVDPARLGLPDGIFMEGFTGYGTFGILEEGLRAHGYSDTETQTILGGNWLRVWRASLRA